MKSKFPKASGDCITDRKRQRAAQTKEKTLDELAKFKKNLRDFGYFIPKSAEFYEVTSGDNKGQIGMKVGEFVHSCHVDTTDIAVLLHFDNCSQEIWVKEYWEIFSLHIKKL